MKISVLVSIVLGFGAVVAALGLMATYGVIPKELTPTEKALKQLEEMELTPVSEAKVSLETETDLIDFGTLEEGVQVTRDFPLKNFGTDPLRLTLKPSCGCIRVKDREIEIPPGETLIVPITIVTNDLYGIVNDKKVLIHSRDASQKQLMAININAVVTRPLEISPPKVTFNRLLADDTVTRETKVYAQHDRDFEITGFRLSRPDTADHFDVAYRRLEPSELPEDGKHGWLVTVTVKPGLPTGSFRQGVELTTTLEKALDTQLEVEGNVVNDIAIVAIGGNFVPKFNLLTLGALHQAQGGQAKLKMLIAGEYADKIELGEPVCEPEFVKVTLGERKLLNNGAASEIPIEIEIPPQSPLISKMGKARDEMGRITIPTNHPSMKEVHILLNFAVEN
ncbi:MAG: DUF1573 domain-containing protein [Planctomycetia bacterium]|nr:DUF1573 domain-containing protein [Planctomycetia bacterium]